MDNHGNQSFNENYYYEIKEREYSIDELVDTPKKVCGLLKAVIVGIVFFVSRFGYNFCWIKSNEKIWVNTYFAWKG